LDVAVANKVAEPDGLSPPMVTIRDSMFPGCGRMITENHEEPQRDRITKLSTLDNLNPDKSLNPGENQQKAENFFRANHFWHKGLQDVQKTH
jgi:hypothetical protein